MPECDGNGCKTAIPWKVTTLKLEVGTGRVPFDPDDVHGALATACSTAGHVPTVVNKPVHFFTLCTGCWAKQASVWGDPETYKPARAKTDDKGVYLQAEFPLFFDKGTKNVNPEAVLSCVCHELMHYWSYLSTGLQNYNRTNNVDWDECLADVLGYMSYKQYYSGKQVSPGRAFAHYYTPYNQYPLFITTAKKKWLSASLGKFLKDKSERDKLPKPLREYFENASGKTPAPADPGAKPPSHGVSTEEVFGKILFKLFSTWFFQGPGVTIEEAPGLKTCESFTKGEYVKTMISALSNVLPGYGGDEDTKHPI